MDITKTTAEVDKLIGDYTLISSKTNNIEIAKSLETAVDLKQKLASLNKNDKNQLFAVRKAIASLVKNAESLEKDSESNVDKVSIKLISTDLKPLKKHIEFTPLWTVLLISFCLGLGTMIGWKRIVVTIGEKIGKTHLTYAQGASAELVAATTIGLSSYYGLPVSTTHVLSSGIAGSMVAAKGVKNLQKSTLINIGLAWLLTLPVTILLAALLFFIFHLFI
jgi:PiT family inorganic phosphate transporter